MTTVSKSSPEITFKNPPCKTAQRAAKKTRQIWRYG
jgi:hypothetical protein